MAAAPNPKLPILIIDDEEIILKSCKMALHLEGLSNTALCSDSRQVMSMLEEHGAAMVLLDLQMPHVSGNTLLPQIVQRFPGVPVVVVTGNDRLETAIQCIKDGALDFLVKPVERERLVTTVKQALSVSELGQEIGWLGESLLRGELRAAENFAAIMTNNAAVNKIFQYVEAVALTSQPVLITGETGVGKELLAMAVHLSSGRRGEYVTVSVAGLDDTMFSDTLFGHVKGAFTGADGIRQGLVGKAIDGTLFLDEIGDMTIPSQVKLLRLLQEGEYMPLGADAPKKTNARIVVATHGDLEALKASGRFRQDLFFRLCTHQVHMPPLRDRLDDLAMLTRSFLREAARDLGKKEPRLPTGLLPLLYSYPFPGNVRELRAMIYDAASKTSSGVLSLDTIKEHMGKATRTHDTPDTAIPGGEQLTLRFGAKLPTMEEAKDLLIEEALRRTGGNKSHAADILGMTRQSLNRRAKQVTE